MAKITKQDVWGAASAIDLAGGKPTVLEIRKRLGAGSYTTITNALREWAGNSEADAVKSVEMPEVVSDMSAQFARDLYAVALESAQRSFDEERLSYQEKLKELGEDRDLAVNVGEVAESDNEKLSAENVQYRDQISTLKADIQVLQARIADMTLDKERALLEAASLRTENGVLRGRLEVFESQSLNRSSPKAKPKADKLPVQSVIS